MLKTSHHKSAVDFLQDLLLIECQNFCLLLLDALLFQFLTGVHFAGCPNLARTDLRCEV